MKRRTILTALGAFAASPALAQVAPSVTPLASAVVQVRVVTGEGPLLWELYGDKAPLTVANILRYVDAGRYDRSEIYRAVHSPSYPEIGLVQGGARPVAGKQIPPVMHESTTLTGLKHEDATLSLARGALNSGTSGFFICCGAAPYLDANPASGDGQGFAAFGKVIEGMEIVRHILQMPKDGVPTNPTMKGQILTVPVPILSAKRV